VGGKKQMLRNGQKVEVDTLGSVVIEYKGQKVNVGSGFSDAEREKIFADPSCIIGKQITVQYFEETENKKGTVSMRFPTKKTIWWEPRDT
jgi:DNA ligase-1